MLPRMIPDPAQYALRRDADPLGHRVHRQAQAVEFDRMALQRRRLAARLGTGELPATTPASPALPAARVTRPDQHRATAGRAGIRTLVHHRLHRSSSPKPGR
jgi:hypothetical protein